MADNTKSDLALPTSANEKRSTVDLLPRYYRTDDNKKFLQATLDQLMQPGTVKKVNGYIGRQNSKSTTNKDVFLTASDKTRQDYQLEPALVSEDYLGNVSFYKDYIDYINQIEVFGGNVKNHERLNQEELYSWNPHICWDKFVNFQNYYWSPYGPPAINIFGQQQLITSEFPVSLADDEGDLAYVFDNGHQVRNPEITLYRGQTYTFKVDTDTHPFFIKTARTTGDLDLYTVGVENNGAETGEITFRVSKRAPDVLYYVSGTDLDLSGIFRIFDINDNTVLNVEEEILDRTQYALPSGLSLSNGMKLKFHGKVFPEKYATDFWYVEGVGTGIKLIAERSLEFPSTYTPTVSSGFDSEGFDTTAFDSSNSFPTAKDYFVINRASLDRNPWSRANRWVHQDVLNVSAIENGTVPSLDQQFRAVRPIIEFEANLKLFNFGHVAKDDVDLIDTVTTDVFSKVEGQLGYYVDGTLLAPGMRVLFTADTDSLVQNKIYDVDFITITAPGRQIPFNAAEVSVFNNVIVFPDVHGLADKSRVSYLNGGYPNIGGLEHREVYYVQVVTPTTIKLYEDENLTRLVTITDVSVGFQKFETFQGLRTQIRLTEAYDAIAFTNETILVKQGDTNSGKMFWFNGTNWVAGPNKTQTNQPPLFDVYDQNGVGYSSEVYPDSSFIGTTVFKYAVGNGVNDKELGFPLKYRSINNIGDIVFTYSLLDDTFTYLDVDQVIEKSTDSGFLKSITSLTDSKFVNGWIKSQVSNVQPIVRIFKDSNLVNNFPVDVYDEVSNLSDLVVRVYINGLQLNTAKYHIETGTVRKFVVLDTDVELTDIVTLKCYARQPKNENGYYETPINFQNNPLNDNTTDFTLGQVTDHVHTIIENIQTFVGNYPGSGNLRDLPSVSAYGTRFVQHTGPLNLSLYHLGTTSANIIEALEVASTDYGNFKRAFLTFADNSGIDTADKEHVDYILDQMSKGKSKSGPYYLSDMFPYSGNIRNEYTVLDSRTKIYPLTKEFTLDKLSNQAVLIYLNGVQLVHSVEYEFNGDFFTILVNLVEGDSIVVYEYDSTDGAFCPPTPTKLGIYPKFVPKKFVDDSYVEPTEVIQGHDGSITVAFGDYRDDLLLELEKRIYNNIKIEYDPRVFDIYDFIPGYNRERSYTREEFDQVLSQSFFRWTSLVFEDYTKPMGFDPLNSFTYNYRDNYAPNGTSVPAFWRGIYKWMLDTDRPHLCPWEMLGYTLQPTWWEEVYGPAPYTKDNLILWEDLTRGIIREPGKSVTVNKKFVRPFLMQSIPVDSQGKLISPLISNIVLGAVASLKSSYFVFGDQSPVETAWRRSSYYAFALLRAALLTTPNQVFGTCFDRSRIVKNLSNQYVYSETNKRIRLKDIVLPSVSSSSSRVFTSGLVNYIVDYLNHDITAKMDQYKLDLQTLSNKLGSKMGGFSSKDKFRLILDSKSPNTVSTNFVPDESYRIFLNTSSPIKKLVYSGVIVTRYPDGYEIKGYDLDTSYFKINPYVETLGPVQVGGISESYSDWEIDSYYVAGKIVKFNSRYYRVKTTHRTDDKFDPDLYALLPDLPIIGGVTATFRKSWNTNEVETVAYGTKLNTIQDVIDFLQGYGSYLTSQGFVFDSFSTNSQTVLDWNTSAKEFLFWTSQNWPEGSLISLSPVADQLTLISDHSVVNDIGDKFYKYSIFQSDGTNLDFHDIDVFRNGNKFVMTSKNSTDGIFSATLYLIQKEHVLLLDNRTIFNDVIYDLEPGYRQDRLRVLGYLTQDWNGSFDIPGFVYDDAVICEWQPWTDYHFGDIVKHKEFYYTAKGLTPGSQDFDANDWILEKNSPSPKLLPNWNYKSEQFTDFYDLDTDNFDTEEQKLAQHLIGYQKRQYLENIIQDDVSQYKFYQGMILEKGTQNVFNKLFDVLSADNQESLSFYEEWAVRVGEYGATNIFNELEISLTEDKFRLNPQPIKFVEDYTDDEDFIFELKPSDLYIKPQGFTITPWKEVTQDPYLRTPGYVRYEDVDHSIDNLDELLVNGDVEQYIDGEYVWCAFEKRSWNVYEYTKINTTWTTRSYADGSMDFSSPDSSPSFILPGSIVAIKSGSFTKFARVYIPSGLDLPLPIPNGRFRIIEDGYFIEGDDLGPDVEVYGFDTRRYTTLPVFDNNITKVWIDDNGDDHWEVRFINETETAWEVKRQESKHADPSVVKKCFIYNKISNELIRYLDVVDAKYGKIPGIADQEIRYKTFYDPAIYSVGDGSVNVLEDSNWTTLQVGQLWWDLTRAKFIENQDALDPTYTSITWNQLYKTASIDVYEWVETEYLPSEWDALADTNEGLTLGISGLSRYGDAVYSVKQTYDNVTQSLVNTYYFWVKGNTFVPNVEGRTTSAVTVSNLISSPTESKYSCIGLLGSDFFNVANVSNQLDADNIAINIQYWLHDNHTLNAHSQWKLISEHPSTSLPKNIEQKWLDSVIGYDYNNRQLPNYNLPVKQRYGIENKPRQSMFVNRIEALKQFIERTNKVLSGTLLVDDYNISPLLTYDTPPTIVSGTWDVSVDTIEERRFVGTALVKTAVLEPVIENGVITSVNILNPGYGYVSAPTITITGGTSPASLKSVINSKGEVETVLIENGGEGYLNDTTLTVRPFAVLVLSDSTNNNKWRVYHWVASTWTYSLPNNQYLQQQYDVTKFWSYKDWYSTGYNQFTQINHILSGVSELYVANVEIGEVVKVQNTGAGGWILLKKFNDISTIDYTQNYEVIGRENGTIQFSKSLYTYDPKVYVPTELNPDPYANVVKRELRVIVNTIKNNLFIDELHVEYLKLFFASLRYALSEQVYVDWAFKSSFVKITHNVGILHQHPTYNSDNLESFEQYVTEVKPYRTKVREYISVYSQLDNSGTMVTDFDLPTVTADKIYKSIRTTIDENGIILTDDDSVNSYPWKSWKDNLGFTVDSIEIVDGGSGYTIAPQVRFVGGFGTGASAVAYISHGRVNRIQLTSGGTGYLKAPTIVLDGGVSSEGVQAKAVAMIESEAVRTNKVIIKFDRISKTFIITDLNHTETMISNGSIIQYRLAFSPDPKTNTYNLKLNGNDVIKSDYSVTSGSNTLRGYTSYFGVLTLNFTPNIGDVLEITYQKNTVHLSATDRINFFYEPVTGQYGKDLSQLMTGVDYGGVTVTGLGFSFAKGWDTIPWGSDSWDAYDPGFDNYDVNILHGTEQVELPYIPEVGERINIYINDIRVDDNYYGVTHPIGHVPNTNAVMTTFIGDGVHNVIDIPPEAYELTAKTESSTIISDIYQDEFLKISSVSVLAIQSIETVIDTFDVNLIKSVRYQVQLSSDDYNQDFDLNVISDQSVSAYDVYLYDDITVIGSVSYSNGELKFTPALSDTSISIVKWEFGFVTPFEVITDSINDTNFQLVTGTNFVFTSDESTVIDEYIAEEFFSTIYFIQLVTGLSTHILKVRVVNTLNDAKFEIVDETFNTDLLDSINVQVVDGNVLLSLTTLVDNVDVIFSRIGLSESGNRPIRSTDLRRLSDSIFTFAPFEFEVNSLAPIVIDSFDLLRASSGRYSIQLKTPFKTELVELDVLLITSAGQTEVIATSTNINGNIGTFTSNITAQHFELVFNPIDPNVHINGVKTLIYVAKPQEVLSNIIMKESVVTYQLIASTETAIDSFDSTLYRSAKYDIQMTSTSGYRSTKVTLIHDGTDVYLLDVNDIEIRSVNGTFNAVIDAGRVLLNFTPDITQPSIDFVMNRILIGDADLVPDPSIPEVLSDDNVLMECDVKLGSGVSIDVDEFSIAEFTSVKYFAQITSDGSEYECIEFRVVTNGSTVDIIQNSILGPHVLGDFVAVIDAGLVKISYQLTSVNNVEIRFVKTALSKLNNLIPTGNTVPVLKKTNLLSSSYFKLTTNLNLIFVDSFPVSDYSNGIYQIQLMSGSNVNILELHFNQDSVTVQFVQYTLWSQGISCGEFGCSLSSGNINVFFTPTIPNVRVTYLKTLINGQIGSRGSDNVNITVLNNTDTFIFRKQTSDGSLPGTPYDPITGFGVNDYDTQLIGGYFQDSTVVGFSPEDVIVDGDQMISPTNSYAPEEVFPGFVSEAVNIKVFQLPLGYSSVSVEVQDPFNKTVFTVIPDMDYSLRYVNGSPVGLLDAGEITADGETSKFSTRAPWLLGKVKGSISVNNTYYDCILFRTNESYDSPDLVGIEFGAPIPAGMTIKYLIEATDNDSTPTVMFPVGSEVVDIVRVKPLGFSQFKDSLNRTHYKRLNKSKTTILANQLLQTDDAIYVIDGDALDIPNPETNTPGIVEINGERIEYLTKGVYRGVFDELASYVVGDYVKYQDSIFEVLVNSTGSLDPSIDADFKLSTLDLIVEGDFVAHLRRGTLGTGAPTAHREGTNVLNIGPSETLLSQWGEYDPPVDVPKPLLQYKDTEIVDVFVTKNTTTIVPISTIVNNRQLSTTTYGNTDEIEVFVAGVRLKKDDYVEFVETNGYPYSPVVPISDTDPVWTTKEGDTKFPSQFKVRGNRFIKLTTPISKGVEVIVVKKNGGIWTPEDVSITFNAATINIDRITLTIPNGVSISNGMPVVYKKDGTNIVGLVDGTTYYLEVINPQIVKLHPNSLLNSPIHIEAGTGTHSFTFDGLESVSISQTDIAKFIRGEDYITGWEGAGWLQYLVDKYQYVLSTDNENNINTDNSDIVELD